MKFDMTNAEVKYVTEILSRLHKDSELRNLTVHAGTIELTAKVPNVQGLQLEKLDLFRFSFTLIDGVQVWSDSILLRVRIQRTNVVEFDPKDGYFKEQRGKGWPNL